LLLLQKALKCPGLLPEMPRRHKTRCTTAQNAWYNVNMRNCALCEREISAARLAALPRTRTCVDCSEERPVKGETEWLGKHTPVLHVVPAGDFQRGRRGFHAQIGANSYNNPRIIRSEVASAEVRNLSKELRTENPVFDRVNGPEASRCHPDAPRINPAGDCLACALRKQHARLR
jgi:hypothetical protein